MSDGPLDRSFLDKQARLGLWLEQRINDIETIALSRTLGANRFEPAEFQAEHDRLTVLIEDALMLHHAEVN